MTVTRVYPSTTQAIYRQEVSYALCFSATAWTGTSTSKQCGLYYSESNCNVYELLFDYDVSAITGSVTSVASRFSYTYITGAGFDISARAYDWGTLNSSDYLSSSEAAALTELVAFSVPNYSYNIYNSSTEAFCAYVESVDNAKLALVPKMLVDNTPPGIGNSYYGTFDSPYNYLTVTWSPLVTGTASATLDAITGTATGAITRFGTVATELGAITGTATGTVTAYGVGTSSLGGLDGATLGTVTVAGTGQGTLGELTATGTGTITVSGQGSGVLGAVVGTANGSSYKPGAGVGLLGGVTGTAVGTSLTIVYGYGGSVLGGVLGQCVAEAQTMENVILIGGGTRNSVVASDNDAILRSAVRSGIA